MQVSVIQLVDAVDATDVDKLPPGLLSLLDASICLGVSTQTVRNRIEIGQIAAVRQERSPGRMGWRWLVPTAEVRRLKGSGMFADRRKALEGWEEECVCPLQPGKARRGEAQRGRAPRTAPLGR
jgi:hypothetical protein